eukprot:CCRYP_002844-RA/>CCRYP_002844-RA protein AED:0.03 eAED:0.03 QI:448/1/1/1/1/1/4/272/975
MNFSSVSFAWWLSLSTSTAFTTMETRRLHNSHLSMLQEQKFDAILTTKRNKNLGYDERTGRFFEVSRSESLSAVNNKSTDVMTDPETLGDANGNESSEMQSIIDIPPMPKDGFYGMNVTGEINGVKMTSSKQTLKRKITAEQDDNIPTIEPISNSGNKNNFADRLANSGAVSAAAMATAAVNAAVSMKTLTAPSTDKSYISLDSGSKPATDTDGLPLVYDKDLIEAYWKKERGALNQRWSYFVGKAVPFLTKLVALFISEGEINERHIPALSRQARMDLQDLGPTFIKAGQMMSVRPDVLPQATLDELTKLQDSVVPFDTGIAVRQIEEELGGPLGQFFTSISEEPVAAASLAQVYVATLNDGKDTRVAVKVQRPQVLSVVSKDLYVLRRAAEVFQGLVERFAPQQKTNYVDLLNEWSIGFYTELDFSNEAKNQQKLRSALIDAGIKGVTVPKVYENLCTRKVLVSEWIDGVKLSDCSPDEIAEVTPIAQEAFLTQLFQFGFFHADPHPGNILKLNEPTPEGHTVVLIDCGLMASIDSADQDHMISAVIHLANKDYASLVDDFIRLKILPTNCDRAAIIPLMDKALSPYVKGGGAKKYEAELRRMYGMEENSVSSQVGGFQAMTQDALTVLNDIPFSIPPYFAILGRAIVTLEGIALTGNENYGIIMESYPFIARKMLAENRPEIQQALQEVLFSVTDNESSSGLKLTRLLALLNNASGAVGTKEGSAFVDLDAIPQDGLSLSDGLKLLLSENAESLRKLLEDEVENIADLFFRQITRKGMTEAIVTFTPPRPPTLPFVGDILSPPKVQLDEIPLPFLLPSKTGNGITPSVSLMTVNDFTDIIAPKLSREEEIYAISLADAAEQFVGTRASSFLRGDGLISTHTAKLVLAAASTGFLGNRNFLGTPAVKNTLNALSGVLEMLDQGKTEKKMEIILLDATSKLSEDEKIRLDDIVTELTRRILKRVRERVASRSVA